MFSLLDTNRGVSLIDVIVGIAILSVVFFGIFGLFQGAIEIIIDSKARSGATTLVQGQMEYIRSLPYDKVGTVGAGFGGVVPDEETIQLNNVTYHRRTVITYYDSSADGEGASDENNITDDYKRVKVEVSWEVVGRQKHMQAVTKVVPDGIENDAGGGSLRFHVFDAQAEPVNDVAVKIVNASTSVNLTAMTNASGTATRAVPAGSGYEITVTKPGYSSVETYDVTSTNVSPDPAHLTVIETELTTASFQIDLLSSLTVLTQAPPEPKQFVDSFADATQLSTTTDTAVSGDVLHLVSSATSGQAISVDINSDPVKSWGTFNATSTIPSGATLEYQFYDSTGGGQVLIPDSELSGNESGFTATPVDLTSLSTSTYETIQVGAYLESGSGGGLPPKVKAWRLDYVAAATPIADVPFTTVGDKMIGEDADGNPVYKTTIATSTDSDGVAVIDPLEWDVYTTTVNATSTGLVVAQSCPPQPVSVVPDTDVELTLDLKPATSNTLLVAVYDDLGNLFEDVNVHLTGNGDDITYTTSACGQVFFEDLAAGEYTLEVSAPGFETSSSTVPVNGYATHRVDLSSSI